MAKYYMHEIPEGYEARIEGNKVIIELKESEDERIRKELVNFLQSPFIKENLTDEKVAPWLAWLERQKYPNEDYLNNPAFLDGFDTGREVQKIFDEQKPASTEDMPYITDEHFFEREPVDSFRYKLAKYMTQNSRKEESPDGYTYHISAESILQMAEEELLKRGVVQKPAEWSEEEYGRLFDIEHYLDGTLQLSPNGKIACIDFLKSLRPQKLDASKLENFDPVDVLNRIKTEWPMAWEKVVWKQEWSKEETKDLVHILKVLDDCYIYGKHDLSKTDYDNLTSTLKSLRPSWKPSEEQMEALGDAMIISQNFQTKSNLASLVRDLKKLIDK